MENRASGVLMHITSLAGKYGVGTFGQEAYDFVDFLVTSGQTYWQILPLTTTSFGDSPYQSFSAMAGNTNLIDLEKLEQEGYLELEDYQTCDFGNHPDWVNFAEVESLRRPILEKAVCRFLQDHHHQTDLSAFETQEDWLNDFAEFMAFKEHFNKKPLQEWDDKTIVRRDNLDDLETYRLKLKDNILYHKVTQYFFDKQWRELKDYANSKGIQIIGDMPIYVSADSVEVWTMPELFKLDEDKNPLCIAGVPADDFSDDGQLWGNPIYNWENHKKTGFAWWIDRIRESFKRYDVLRIDHFKGFSDYWEIPAGASSANTGYWQAGPGIALFEAIKNALGELPIIAENLGYIDDKAKVLLKQAAFPGMKILCFGLLDSTGHSIDIAHHFTADTVAYTGTHDNDVINGWYNQLSAEQQDFVNDYTHRHEGELISQAMLRTLFASVSEISIVCMQDVLDLPANTRMNTPNTIGGNWKWRMLPSDLTDERICFLRRITDLYARTNKLYLKGENDDTAIN